MATTRVEAADYYWDGTTGDYNTPTNWDPDYPIGNPTTGDFMYVNNDGTCQITSGITINSPLYVYAGQGAGTAGTILQSGGLADISGGLRIGRAGGTGVYDMTGGSVYGRAITEASLYSLLVGDGAGSDGTLNMSGSAAGTFQGLSAQIGSKGGAGQLDMSGTATLNFNFTPRDVWSWEGFLVGNGVDSSAGNPTYGTVFLRDNASIDISNGYTSIGIWQYSHATMSLTENASFTTNADMAIGDNWNDPDPEDSTPPHSEGNVDLSGNSTLNVGIGLRVGKLPYGVGSLNLSDSAKATVGTRVEVGYWGGTGALVIADTAEFNHAGGDVRVGTEVYGTTAAEGTVVMDGGTFNNLSAGATIRIGYVGGIGAWTQNAGTLANPNGSIVLGDQGGTGTFNLNGGVVQTQSILAGGNAPGSATLNFNGGVLMATANGTLVGNAGATPVLNAVVQTGGAIIDTNGRDVAVAIPLLDGGGGGGLTKLGGGTLTLSGTNSYGGQTSVAQGDLVIAGGGSITNVDGRIAYETGLTAQVTVTGPASKWTNTGNLYVGGDHLGAQGTGTLTVLNGGTVDAGNTLTIWSTGAVYLTSGVITFQTLDNSHGGIFVHGDGILTIEGGTFNPGTPDYAVDGPTQSTLNLTDATTTLAGTLKVGDAGNATLTVTQGADLSNAAAQIAVQTGSTGNVLVDGSGSTWAVGGSLYVGGSNTGSGGHGDLTVQNRGTVTVNNTLKIWSTGDFQLSSGTTTCRSFDNSHGGTFNHDGGTLTVEGGAFLPGAGGYAIDGGGNPTVNMAGATAAIGGTVRVGEDDDGTLRITGGSVVNNTGGVIGVESGSQGVVVVDGPGTTWTNNGDLGVGDAGRGTLRVINGGAIESASGTIGAVSGAEGTVTIRGDGSTWTNQGDLTVGDGGAGRMLIFDGGLVAVEGTLTIDGGGSGDSAIYMGSHGTLTLPGYLDQSLDDFLDAIVGTDAIRYWDDSTGVWSKITNATRDVDYTLEYMVPGIEGLEDVEGAEGFTALTWIKKPIVTVSTRALGDANGDYRVDELDAKLMAANWGQSGDWLD
ncbi:MAG: hypothetical protein GX621_07720, partial [Pirellulaceae bacterium]|nr:hypothetical protein [Pirellulaceae bacterium]